MSFEAILSRIANGQDVSPEEFCSFLSLEKLKDRANANYLLADAYWKAGRKDYLVHARTFVQRAWMLSRFSETILPLYIQIHSALDDIPPIREAYKRLGITKAAQGNLTDAIKYFDMWQYAYVQFKNLEIYDFDYDILDCVNRLAHPYRLSPKLRADLSKDHRIRVAYLVHAITAEGAVLVRLNLFFAQFHDRLRVTPTFFVPESEQEVLSSSAGREHLRLFESYGCKVIMAPNYGTTRDRLLDVAQKIQQAGTDILVTSAALAHFNHYFITCLKPAPIIVPLVQGPPEQFAPPSLDWGIAWNTHPLIDSPLNCFLTNMEVGFPDQTRPVPYKRSELEIPDQAPIIGSAGRYHKFQDPRYWKAIVDLLDNHHELYYFGIGIEEKQIPFLPEIISDEARSRIRFFKWSGNDYLRALSLVDVLIDTFPSGGGTTLTDAMALSIPIVSFENNYFRRYTTTDWSPAHELINIPEIIVPRGDFDALKRVVSDLLSNPGYRRDLGRRCQKYYQENKSSPPRGVHRCEDLYFRIIQQQLFGKETHTGLEVEVEELSRQDNGFRPAPRPVVVMTRQLKRVLRLGERVLDRIAEGRTFQRTGIRSDPEAGRLDSSHRDP